MKSASLLTLGGLVAGKAETSYAAAPAVSETMAKKSIGLQIYSLGGELTKDVPEGMKKLKKMDIQPSSWQAIETARLTAST